MRVVLLTALLALGLLYASPANAEQFQVNPFITGSGSITAGLVPPYSCTNSTTFGGFTLDCTASPFEDSGAGVVLLATPNTDPPGHWEFAQWADGTCPDPIDNTCIVRATDPSPAPEAVFTDSIAPTLGEVTISPAPHAPWNAVKARFSANEWVSFGCQLDADPAMSGCPSGIDLLDLSPGPHTFTVWGIDGSKNVSKKVSVQFTIEAPPVTPAPVTPKPPIVPLFPRVLGPSAVKAKVSRKRAFSLGKVRLVCPAVATPCKAKATIKGRLRKGGKQVRLVSKRLSLRPSSRTVVKLKLGRKVAKALRKRGRLKGVASLEVRAPDVTTRKDVAVTLRAPKKR